jgi:multiple sugar transport system substrate-binding protein
MSEVTSTSIPRRRFLIRTAMALAGAGAVMPVLQACGQQAPPAPTAVPAKPAAEPTKPAAAAEAPKPTAPAAIAPTKARKVNLQFLYADGPPQKDKLELIVESFKTKNPGSQVETIWSPWGQFETKIVAMYAGGTAPDFHQCDDDAVPFFAGRDMIGPVDDIIKDNNLNKGDYHKMIWDLTTVKGKIMALTISLKPRAYIYNVDLFEKAGIKAPTTWSEAWSADQLLENAKKLTQGDVFGFSNDYWIWDSIPAMNGGTHFPADWSDYLEPNYADTYQWISDLAYKQKVAPAFDMKNQIGELTLFTSGKLAIWNSGVWNTKQLNDVAKLKWDVMPVAKLSKSAMAEASLFCFTMSKTTKAADDTSAFASFFMGDDAQQILALNGDLMPTKTSIQKSKIFADPTRQPKNTAIWVESLDNQGRWPFLYNGIELRDQIKPQVDLIWAGQKPAKEALEAARPKVMELLKVSREKMGN